MIIEPFSMQGRSTRFDRLSADFVVVGGGLAGICAAIEAARSGISVILVQDRPVVGGNASSEVRLWTLGATSHMGNNNRWAREGGLIDEILVENLYRNREGNALILDTILLEKVLAEKNLKLLLNTSVYECLKSDADTIKSVQAYCSQNSTTYEIEAPLFCDASGDGILGFCAGASFRMGAETKEEFGELFAPDESYGELLGHTIYFYSKDIGKAVDFVAPSYALKDIESIPRFRSIHSSQQGCNFWWFEYGGRRDTVHETEEIKWALWKVVYGVWDYIKNSGKFPEAETMTLEWVGTIPGKRESRRFEGPYMLRQQDVVEQTVFSDAVAFGGWSLDLHPSNAIYSDASPCNQWHSKGIYGIPYRCLYSKNIQNLYLAGRIISASHVAFGSSRVMATCAHGGQAVGVAAAQCIEKNLTPAKLLEGGEMKQLQERLNRKGQSIPGIEIEGDGNLLKAAVLKASSSLSLNEIRGSDEWMSLIKPVAQMLPVAANTTYLFKLKVRAESEQSLRTEIRRSVKAENHTPEVVLEEMSFDLYSGEQEIEVSFNHTVSEDQYIYLCLFADETVCVEESAQRFSGILSVYRKENKEVSNYGKQEPPEGIGIDCFEFWTAERRPGGKNLAMNISPAIESFDVKEVQKGLIRPISQPNAWIADPSEERAVLELKWEEVQHISEMTLYFDPDYDHPMESVQMGHPERVTPFCVQRYRVKDSTGKVLYETSDNHQAINRIEFPERLATDFISIELEHPSDLVPASLFYIDIR